MKKQMIVVVSAISLVTILFIFGRTTGPKPVPAKTTPEKSQLFNVQTYIEEQIHQLPARQSAVAEKLATAVSASTSPSQRLASLQAAARFWADSVQSFEPFAYYSAEAAKLENSEKNLTFAAQLFLGRLRSEKDAMKLEWEANEAIVLFEKALAINPDNDDLKIGLGSAYIFGKGRNGDAAPTMKGVQELLAVVRRDSMNMRAQLVLGIGGAMSGQYDKAIARLLKVVQQQPDNAEAIAFLADAYAGKGEKAEAIKWYTISKRLINDPHYTQEVDERIRTLR